MKKTILILVIVLVLTLVVTMPASATKPTFFSGFFYFEPSWDFCFASGEFPVMDYFMYGCGNYLTDAELTAIWEGWVDGKFGTCVIHARGRLVHDKSHVTVNQCTGDLAGLHIVAYGYFDSFPFTWDGTYHWETLDD